MTVLVRERPDDVDVTRVECRREAFRGPAERRVQLRQLVVDHEDARPHGGYSWIQHEVMPP